jgi:hypothetical protein
MRLIRKVIKRVVVLGPQVAQGQESDDHDQHNYGDEEDQDLDDHRTIRPE